jgi:hypothetical protein
MRHHEQAMTFRTADDDDDDDDGRSELDEGDERVAGPLEPVRSPRDGGRRFYEF